MTPEKLRMLAADMNSRHPDEAAQACLFAANRIELLQIALVKLIAATELHHRNNFDLENKDAYAKAKRHAKDALNFEYA